MLLQAILEKTHSNSVIYRLRNSVSDTYRIRPDIIKSNVGSVWFGVENTNKKDDIYFYLAYITKSNPTEGTYERFQMYVTPHSIGLDKYYHLKDSTEKIEHIFLIDNVK